jgi:hypothetical protein
MEAAGAEVSRAPVELLADNPARAAQRTWAVPAAAEPSAAPDRPGAVAQRGREVRQAPAERRRAAARALEVRGLAERPAQVVALGAGRPRVEARVERRGVADRRALLDRRAADRRALLDRRAPAVPA